MHIYVCICIHVYMIWRNPLQPMTLDSRSDFFNLPSDWVKSLMCVCMRACGCVGECSVCVHYV